MKKQWEITYEVVGGLRTDKVYIWTNSVAKAIKEFINMEFEVSGIKIKYSEYSIISIS